MVRKNFAMSKLKQIDLIFDGDSITAGWGGKGKQIWDKYYGTRNAFNFGISGDQIENVLWRLKVGQVDGLNPKLVVLMIGTNNFKTSDTDEQIAEGIHNLWREYTTRLPKAKILALGIFPRAAKSSDPFRGRVLHINQLLASFRDNPQVTFLDIGSKFLDSQGDISPDILSDFVHPTDKGYQIWADAIEAEVKKVLPGN